MLWIHELLWILCSWKYAQKIGKSRSGSWTSWVLPCETASSTPLHRSKHYGQTNPLPSDAPNLGISVPKCSHRSMLYHRQYSSSHLASNNLRSILFNNRQQDYHQLTLSLSSAKSRLLLVFLWGGLILGSSIVCPRINRLKIMQFPTVDRQRNLKHIGRNWRFSANILEQNCVLRFSA